MCKSPILVNNTNRWSRFVAEHFHTDFLYNVYFKDTTSHKIPVPCGKCPDCVRLRQSYFVQRCICESFDNDLYFCTLTYSNKQLPNMNINGYKISYADISHVQKMLKRIRKDYNLPHFRYMLVSEFGSSRHRPHFHLLLSFPKFTKSLAEIQGFALRLHDIFLKEWRVNKGSRRVPIYEPLCDYRITRKGRNFDLHYVNPSLSDGSVCNVAYYVSKYMLKSNPYVDALKSALFYNLPDYDTFKEVWKKVRPRFLLSKGFGNPKSPKVEKHIRDSIQFSIDTHTPYPVFVNPISSTSSPLCPYYRNKFMTIEDFWNFHYLQSPDIIDNVIPTTSVTHEEYTRNVQSFDKIRGIVDSKDTYFNDEEFDYLDDFLRFTEDYIDVPIQFNKLNNQIFITDES